MSNAVAAHAVAYITRLNLPLVPTPPGCKGPRGDGWQLLENAIRTADGANSFYGRNPGYGLATVLAQSGSGSLDIDDELYAAPIFKHFGMDLKQLRLEYPCIQSRPGRFRLMFKVPSNTALRPRVMRYPKKDEPNRFFVVAEYRCGLLADTLPPTIHPSTGRPYVWTNPPRNGFPELSTSLLAPWLNWESTERAALALCPWYVPPPPRPVRVQKARDPNSPSVIREFNKAHDIVALLEAYGYERRGKRFTKPKSSHAPGLVLLDDGRVFSHHAGDSLGDGKPHDAFDLFVTFDHGGDFRAAVRAAAKALGLEGHR